MENKLNYDIDYKVLDKKMVYQGKRISVEELHYYNKRKKQIIYREHVHAGNAVIIMPITDNNEFIMIREPRTPIGKNVLAFPAGMIEIGENSNDAALRELEEEIGYKAGCIKKLREVYPAIGYSDEKVTIYIASKLIKTQTHFDETEDIEVVKVKIDDAKEMLNNNDINTSSELIALFHYFMYINK